MIYRTQVKIIADILSATREYEYDEQGAGVTTIIRKANLSHTRLIKMLRDLVSSGLLEQTTKGKVSKYRISIKGEHFLREYHRFEEFATSFGLRL